MKKILQSVSMALVFLMAFSSCELTTSPEDLADAASTISENVDTELKVIKVFENVNNFGFNKEALKSALLPNTDPDVSWSENTLTLDFTNVNDASGKIIVEFSGVPEYTVDLVATVTFDEYENGGTAMAGTMKLTIEEINDTFVLFGMETDGDVSITEGGVTYFWSCDQTLKWYEGFTTLLNITDDSFLVNGNANQVMDSVTNKTVFTNIDYASSCKYIKDGILVLTEDFEGNKPIEITADFGIDKDGNDSGECDSYVKLTSGGITMKIDLDSY